MCIWVGRRPLTRGLRPESRAPQSSWGHSESRHRPRYFPRTSDAAAGAPFVSSVCVPFSRAFSRAFCAAFGASAASTSVSRGLVVCAAATHDTDAGSAVELAFAIACPICAFRATSPPAAYHRVRAADASRPDARETAPFASWSTTDLHHESSSRSSTFFAPPVAFQVLNGDDYVAVWRRAQKTTRLLQLTALALVAAALGRSALRELFCVWLLFPG